MYILNGEHKKGRSELKALIQGPLFTQEPTFKQGEALFYCYRYIGISYQREINNSGLEKAEDYFNKANKQLKYLKQSYAEQCKALDARLLRNYGNLYQTKGEYNEALELYAESLNLFELMEDEEHIGITHVHIAQTLISRGTDIEECVYHLETVKNISSKIGWMSGEIASSINYGRLNILLSERSNNYLEKVKFLSNAKSNLLNAQSILFRTDEKYWIGRTHELLEQVSSKQMELEESNANN